MLSPWQPRSDDLKRPKELWENNYLVGYYVPLLQQISTDQTMRFVIENKYCNAV